MNPSYSAQLLRGSDYWRTVLDGAGGIDIYGHNGVSVADIDNDGFPEIFLTCYGKPNVLYHNVSDGQGGRRFVDISAAAGCIGPPCPGHLMSPPERTT